MRLFWNISNICCISFPGFSPTFPPLDFSLRIIMHTKTAFKLWWIWNLPAVKMENKKKSELTFCCLKLFVSCLQTSLWNVCLSGHIYWSFFLHMFWSFTNTKEEETGILWNTFCSVRKETLQHKNMKTNWTKWNVSVAALNMFQSWFLQTDLL